jgi:hypothetical protein
VAAASDAWPRASNVAQPSGFMDVHTDASGNPYMRGCAPCHPGVDTVMVDVTGGPGGLVAAGYVLPDFQGATWFSSNGADWTVTDDFPDKTTLAAVAANDSRYVAVGLDGQGGIAWDSSDGRTWQKTASVDAFAERPMRMTSVVPFKGGFVAGGYRGTEFFTADAAFWTSPDGLTWTRSPDSAALKGARVAAIAAGGPGLVAVGEAGPADAPGPAVVWTSADGVTWKRVPDAPVFDGFRVRSIANVPAIGLVAVGEDIAGDTGWVLTSTDGTHWTRVPSTPAFGRAGIQTRMYDVTPGPNGVVVVGTATEGIQYGEATVWTSPDGRTWTKQPTDVSFLDTEMNGAALWNGSVVSVGDRGAPDAYQAVAWVSPTSVGK